MALMIMAVLIPIILIIVILCLTSSERSRRSKCWNQDKNCIYLPNSWLYTEIYLSLSMALVTLIEILSNRNKKIIITLLILNCLIHYMAVVWKNYYIIFDDKGFWVNFSSREKIYFTYEQITGYRPFTSRYLNGFHVFVNGKTIVVYYEASNYEEFLLHIKQKYRMLHNGEELPEKKNKS